MNRGIPKNPKIAPKMINPIFGLGIRGFAGGVNSCAKCVAPETSDEVEAITGMIPFGP